MQQPQSDLILIAIPTDSPDVDLEVVRRAIVEVVARLENASILLWKSVEDSLDGSMPTVQNAGRIVVIPISLFPIGRAEVRACLWLGGVPPSTPVFLADPPTPSELGTWIRGSVHEIEDGMQLVLVPAKGADAATLDRLAAIAYWTRAAGDCWIQGDEQSSERGDQAPCQGWIAFSREPYLLPDGTTARGSNIQSEGELSTWHWLGSNTLATWMVGRYLQAVTAHPIAFPDSHEEEILWRCLKTLADRQYAMLPNEYAGKLNAVAPSSMGSARLIYDAEGKVAWDTIWTSFCDLAMAGGPPHRGKLLSNVPVEEIQARLKDYDTVCAELHRGIRLASSLATCDSKDLGWVGVCCHDEAMAAWMLRAIIVENILVRREGSVLYLPAGPDFRIEKEIKNVITAVAKTTHYWFGHLKTRQPPKPL
jgi:hypothetical protein